MGLNVGAQRNLIINADDYGMTAGVNRGIEEAIDRGIVVSTSCLVYNRPPEIPGWMRGRVGVHLRLTDGIPALDPSQVDTLVDNQGLFPLRPEEARVGDSKQIRAEWERQIDLFRDGVGGDLPTHLDTHHLMHRNPGAFDVYESLCRDLGVAGFGFDPEQSKRLPIGPDHFETRWVGDGSVIEMLCESFENNRTVCLMTHPGYVDEELRQCSKFTDMRYAQLRTLLDPAFLASLEANGIRVVNMPRAL